MGESSSLDHTSCPIIDSELFRSIWDILAEAVALYNRDSVVIEANPAFFELIGLTREQTIGHDLAQIFAQDFGNQARAAFAARFDSVQDTTHYEATVKRLDGQERVLEVRDSFLERDGQRVAMLAIAHDITARKRMEEALRTSEQRYELVVRNLPNGAVILFDQDFRVLVAGGAIFAQLGLDTLGMAGKSIFEVLSPEVVMQAAPAYQAVLAGHTAAIEVVRGGRTYEMRHVPVRDGIGVVKAGLVLSQDITERKQSEKTQAQQSILQTELLQQLVTAQQGERRRLAMELHDGPLQSLAVSLMSLDRAEMRMGRNELDLVRHEIKFARGMLSEIVKDIRAVLANLNDEILAERGIVAALEHHAELMEAGGETEVSVEADGVDAECLSLERSVLVYRLAQEAVANARKHSQATRIRIVVTVEHSDRREWLRLAVIDNGVGFDPEAGIQRHRQGFGLGLKSMRDRILSAGGDMKITSAPGAGTTVEFWCPV